MKLTAKDGILNDRDLNKLKVALSNMEFKKGDKIFFKVDLTKLSVDQLEYFKTIAKKMGGITEVEIKKGS